MDAKSRVALVTGASRGIGRAIAVKLAEAGIDVAIGYEKNQAEAEQVVQRGNALGRRAMAIRTDLRDPQQIAFLVQSIEDALGRIDILVNNAAIGPQRSLEAITVEEWDQVMEVKPSVLLPPLTTGDSGDARTRLGADYPGLVGGWLYWWGDRSSL